MKNLIKLILLPLAIALAAISVAGCERDEGAFEDLGEKADEAINDAERKLEDAAD